MGEDINYSGVAEIAGLSNEKLDSKNLSRAKKSRKKIAHRKVSVASVALASTLAMMLPSTAAVGAPSYKHYFNDESVIREAVQRSRKVKRSILKPVSPASSNSSKHTASRLVMEAKKSIRESARVVSTPKTADLNDGSRVQGERDTYSEHGVPTEHGVSAGHDVVAGATHAEGTAFESSHSEYGTSSVGKYANGLSSNFVSEPVYGDKSAEGDSQSKEPAEGDSQSKESVEDKSQSKKPAEGDSQSKESVEDKSQSKEVITSNSGTDSDKVAQKQDANSTNKESNKKLENPDNKESNDSGDGANYQPTESESADNKLSKGKSVNGKSVNVNGKSVNAKPVPHTPTTPVTPTTPDSVTPKSNITNPVTPKSDTADPASDVSHVDQTTQVSTDNPSVSSNSPFSTLYVDTAASEDSHTNDLDTNSQVIKPNIDNTEAENESKANEQVQTDKKPDNTYNLKILYTLGGAPNKQLVQPYELTIDTKKLNELGDSNNYEYIPIPQTSGYSPQITYSGNYKYFVKDASGNYVEDNGTYGQKAQRYLQLSKSLINTYCNQKDDKTGTYSGQIVIDYAPHIANYYVRHLLQSKTNPEEFDQDYAVGTDVINVTTTGDDGQTVTKDIHVTKHKGTVGYNVYPQALDIPGYEPEHNLVSSPLSDKADDKDNKLVLNLRYYRKTYEVTYDTDGGTDVTAQRVYYGVKIPEVKDPTKRGYTFAGWQVVDSSGKPVPKQPNISDVSDETHTLADEASFPMPNGDVHFKARWKANETTSYRVNVWVQKADLVDEAHPESLKNYDFVTTVVRNNVKTGSNVALNSMKDSGEIADANASSSSANNAVENPELGLTATELQGANGGSGNDGIIKKFNWMSDDPVTSLSGYNVNNPYDPKNAGKDLFTRYFHVNRKLSQSLNKSTKVDSNDLNNTLNLVYDRSMYEIIFAAPKKTNEIYESHGDARGEYKEFSNLGVYRIDKKTGKKVMYCYPGNESDCAEEFKGRDTDDEGNKIIHKAYRANVRYGQSLAGIMPAVSELKFSKKRFGSWGWIIAPDRNAKFYNDQDYRDMPPYRFTRKEFASSKFTVPKAFKVESELSGNAEIGGDPNNPTLADNQRVLYHQQISAEEWPEGTDYEGQAASAPIHVAIHFETVDSANSKDANKHHVVELSDLSYYKDDTRSKGQTYTPPILAGFTAVDDKFEPLKNDCTNIELSKDEFEKKIREEWNNYKTIHPNENISLEDFKNKVHIYYRDYMPYDVKKKYPQDTNYFLSLTYARNKYNVEFYNPGDLNPIASEKLAYETNLSNRNYDGDVKSSEGTDVSFPNNYTFTLGGTKYTISRPSTVPNDYIFAGWARDAAGTNLIKGSDTTMPVNGIKLYSVWRKGEAKHTVTIDYNMADTNGQDIQETRQFNHKAKLSESSINIPTRSGYDFYGWQIVKKGESSVTPGPYAFGNGIVEDITLKAVWIKDTRYSATVNHVFLKPGYTFSQYNTASDADKKSMVEREVKQTTNGLRAGLRYSAEASYRDAQHFPDQNYQSFEISKNSDKNTATFVYQAYNTRKYTIKYIDQNGKALLPDKTVSSVNQKYDVAFYTPIAGFKPSALQQDVLYQTGPDGKQSEIPVYTFTYNDVRVLKRKNDSQARPDNYTRYVFKVADGEQNMGSIADYNNKPAGEDGLVYDVIGGTKAYEMPLPQAPIAKKGYEFAGWTSKVYIKERNGNIKETVGLNRLPILSETQSNPRVVYIANFRLKTPTAVTGTVVRPGKTLVESTENKQIKDLVKNAGDYSSDAQFTFAEGQSFDNTPGLHKITIKVTVGKNSAEVPVFYKVLPEIIYSNDWSKYKDNYSSEYVPLKFASVNTEGEIVGKEPVTFDAATGTSSITAYVYKGKSVNITLPKAFGKDYNSQNYNYVFKGWVKSKDGNIPQLQSAQKFDFEPNQQYVNNVTFDTGTTYYAVYKKISYVSGKSDSGEIPAGSVVAIFKPAPGRLWNDGTNGPKVFYIKKGKSVQDHLAGQKSILEILQGKLTGVTGWSQSSMIPIDENNTKDRVDYAGTVVDWNVNHTFQEFVANQAPLAKPKGLGHPLLAVQGVESSLPKLEEYIENYTSELKKDPNISEVKVEYASKAPNVDNAATYTVPLKVTIKYKDVRDPQPYDVVGVLQVLPKLVPQNDNLLGGGTPGSGQGATPGTTTKPDKTVVQKITSTNDENSPYAKVTFENAADTTVTSTEQGTLNGNGIFYVVKNVSDGVTAPQAVGKDHDEKGYHYVFKGWKLIEGEIIDASGNTIIVNGTAHTSSATVPSEHDAAHPSAARSAFTAMPFTTFLVTGATTPTEINESNVGNVENVNNAGDDRIYTSEEVKKWKFRTNARLQAVYDYVPDAIDATKKEFIAKHKDALKNYTPVIFMPGFGHTWNDGNPKPDIKYLRNFGKDGSEKNISLTKKEAEEKAKSLSGFMGWKIYGADGTELSADEDDTWNATSSRIFIAEQKSTKDVKTSSFVLSVGDEIPGLDKYVKNDDGTGVSLYSITGQGAKPKSSTKDSGTSDGSHKSDYHVYKPGITTVTLSVTYPTDKIDKNGEAIKRTVKVPLHIHVLPNVIAQQDLPAAGTIEDEFISKNYTKFTYVTDPNGKMMSNVHTYWVRKGKESAIKDYIPGVRANAGYVFKDWMTLSSSNKDDNRKASDSDREGLAKIAELRGENYLASIIRSSKKSTLAALKNLLLETKPSDYMQYAAAREKLAQIAEDSGKLFVANIIRKSKKSSIANLKNLLAEAGVKDARIALPNVETDTIIVANFEQMDPVEFKFSGKAVEGVPATFTLANLTKGVLNADGTTDTNAEVSVNNKNFTVNALLPSNSSSLSQLGISRSCKGTTCKISGTPKIVDGKKVVELTFTSTDKYGRESRVTVDIEVLPAVNNVLPYAPTPVPPASSALVPLTPAIPIVPATPIPVPSAPQPEQKPKKEIKHDQEEETDFDFDFDQDAVPTEPPTEEPIVPAPFVRDMQSHIQKTPAVEPHETVPTDEPKLANTGADVYSALLAGATAAIGFTIGKVGRHRRKRSDKGSSK